MRDTTLPATSGSHAAANDGSRHIFAGELHRRVSSNHSWPTKWLGKYLPYLLIVASITFIYRSWLSAGVIVGGDWSYATDFRLRDFWPNPSIWDAAGGTGGANILGGPNLPLVFLQALLSHGGINYALSERIVWTFPCLLVGSFAAYGLARSFFASRLAGLVSGLFTAFNYYVVAIMSGGQFTVINGCLLMPLALWLFERALQSPTVSRLAPIALVISVQVMYDLRSTYLTFGVLLFFALFYVIARPSAIVARRVILRVVLQFVVIGVVVALIHSFWLLPARFAEKIALPAGYNAVGWVNTLSYFRFSNGFSLFRSPLPNASIGPVFFLLPILAFGLLLRRRPTFIDLFLLSLALLSIFFLKGGNEPAGNIYNWMFTHFPGFNMYRDPSKFYQPLTLAYALLLGRVASISPTPYGRSMRTRRTVGTSMLWLAPVVCFIPVLALMIPVATTTPRGTLAPVTVPAEYIALHRYMDGQQHFSRILWVFGQVQYVGATALHPVVGADDIARQLQLYVREPASSPAWLRLPQAQAVLRSLSVEYVAVGDGYSPGDSLSLLTRYRARETQAVFAVRSAFPHFPEIRIGNIHLFRNPSYLPALFVTDGPVTASQVSMLLQRATAPVQWGVRRTGVLGEYSSACRSCLVNVSSSRTRYEAVVHYVRRPFLLVLNQSFDPNWVAYVEPSAAAQPFWWTWTHPAIMHRYHTLANGFANAWLLNASGSYRVVVEYWPQRLTDIGFILCWLTIAVCTILTVAPAILKRTRRLDHAHCDSHWKRSDHSHVVVDGVVRKRVSAR